MKTSKCWGHEDCLLFIVQDFLFRRCFLCVSSLPLAHNLSLSLFYIPISNSYSPFLHNPFPDFFQQALFKNSHPCVCTCACVCVYALGSGEGTDRAVDGRGSSAGAERHRARGERERASEKQKRNIERKKKKQKNTGVGDDTFFSVCRCKGKHPH